MTFANSIGNNSAAITENKTILSCAYLSCFYLYPFELPPTQANIVALFSWFRFLVEQLRLQRGWDLYGQSILWYGGVPVPLRQIIVCGWILSDCRKYLLHVLLWTERVLHRSNLWILSNRCHFQPDDPVHSYGYRGRVHCVHDLPDVLQKYPVSEVWLIFPLREWVEINKDVNLKWYLERITRERLRFRI